MLESTKSAYSHRVHDTWQNPEIFHNKTHVRKYALIKGKCFKNWSHLKRDSQLQDYNYYAILLTLLEMVKSILLHENAQKLTYYVLINFYISIHNDYNAE